MGSKFGNRGGTFIPIKCLVRSLIALGKSLVLVIKRVGALGSGSHAATGFVWGIPMGSVDYFDNVITKLIVNNTREVMKN